jgi:hypothetical protein
MAGMCDRKLLKTKRLRELFSEPLHVVKCKPVLVLLRPNFGDQRRGCHKAMRDIVNHYTKTVKRPYPQQRGVARLREYDLVNGFMPFCAQNGMADRSLNGLTGSGLECAASQG